MRPYSKAIALFPTTFSTIPTTNIFIKLGVKIHIKG